MGAMNSGGGLWELQEKVQGFRPKSLRMTATFRTGSPCRPTNVSVKDNWASRDGISLSRLENRASDGFDVRHLGAGVHRPARAGRRSGVLTRRHPPPGECDKTK